MFSNYKEILQCRLVGDIKGMYVSKCSKISFIVKVNWNFLKICSNCQIHNNLC